MKHTEGVCEMCGNYVGLRQKAHIVAEELKVKSNLLMLCNRDAVNFLSFNR